MAKKRTSTSGQALLIDVRTPKETFRELRNYLAGQWIGATRDEALLDEVLKCLFCKLYIEKNPESQQGKGLDDVLAESTFYRQIFARIRKEYSDIYSRETEILLDPPTLVHVMRALRFALLDASRDPIGDAYEVFAGSESRSKTGQFFTPRNAVDALVRCIDPKPGERIIDPACGAGGFLASVAQHWASQNVKESELASASSKLFGIEKDQYLSGLARIHVSLLTKGHSSVVCGDSLSMVMENDIALGEQFELGSFDVVLTNPPFGVSIVAANAKTLQQFELARTWKQNKATELWEATGEIRSQVPPQVLFVERCLSMVREGGRLGMVLPESLLSNKSYRHVVEFIRTKASVDGVIGMPESLFKTSGKGGTHTKTCLLLLTKSQSKKNGKVFMAEAKWCGHDSRAREIPFDDLPTISANFEKHKKRKKLEPSTLGFAIEAASIEGNVLCPRYYDPELDSLMQKLAESHDLVKFGELLDEKTISIDTGHEVGKLAYGTGEIPFVRTSDLSNWEIKADPKHCISKEIFLSLQGKQDVQPGDILMVKDGTYLIGTCAIVTEYDREIIYQSHIYKIRVHQNKRGLTPQLLLAILSSSIVQQQIKSKQFTQDIIDSLGERIKELLIPIPKSSEKRDYIAELVRKVIDDRIEARELYRKARLEVMSYA